MRLNAEEVATLVGSLLSEELRWDEWRGHPNPVAGHCYTASEVCRALRCIEWEPQMVPHEDFYRWFLRHCDTGEILDHRSSVCADAVLREGVSGPLRPAHECRGGHPALARAGEPRRRERQELSAVY